MRTTMVMLLVLSGCASLQTKPDRDVGAEVAASWRGRPLLDMEKHPVFSAMKAERQEASDGTVIFHHVRCVEWQDNKRQGYTGDVLLDAVGGAGSTASTRGQACCDRQFVTRAGLIEEYRQVASGGECRAEEKYSAAAK